MTRGCSPARLRGAQFGPRICGKPRLSHHPGELMEGTWAKIGVALGVLGVCTSIAFGVLSLHDPGDRSPADGYSRRPVAERSSPEAARKKAVSRTSLAVVVHIVLIVLVMPLVYLALDRGPGEPAGMLGIMGAILLIAAALIVPLWITDRLDMLFPGGAP